MKSVPTNCAGFLFLGTTNIIFGTLKIKKNKPDIAISELESNGFLEQAGINKKKKLKMCLSFGWKENTTVQRAHCALKHVCLHMLL